MSAPGIHSTVELLDAAKRAQGVESDYRLAKLLGVKAGSSVVGTYRSGRNYPDDNIAQRLADLAGLDRGYVVACIHAERAGEGEGGFWHRIADRLRAAPAEHVVWWQGNRGPEVKRFGADAGRMLAFLHGASMLQKHPSKPAFDQRFGAGTVCQLVAQ